MRRTALLVGGALGVVAFGGCAETPAGVSNLGLNLIQMSMTMKSAVDPNAYYLFMLNTVANNSAGPTVLAADTPFLGNGLATGSYDYYVEYHQGQFELFMGEPESQGVTPTPAQALGVPYSYNDSSSVGTLSCTLTTGQINPAGNPALTQVEMNFITVNEIVLPGDVPATPRQSCGVGSDGTQFLTLLLQNGNQIVDNGIPIETTYGGQPISPAYQIVNFSANYQTGS
jgi:hypothetical protein